MDELQRLADRVRQDDSRAATALRKELQTQMIRMVRRVVRTGKADSPLSRRILAEAGPLSLDMLGLPAEERERHIARVARHLCESVMNKLRPSPGGQHLRETVRL